MVAAPRWQDPDHRVLGKGGRLCGAPEVPHHRDLHAARGAAGGQALEGARRLQEPRDDFPEHEEMNKEIVERVVKRPLADIKPRNGKPAISLFATPLTCISTRLASSSSVDLGMTPTDWPRDHHRHLRRLGRPRRRRVLQQGPHQGGPPRRLHLPPDEWPSPS